MKDLRKFQEAAKALKEKLLYSETKHSDFIEGLAGRENIIGVGTELRIVKGKVTDELCLKVDVRKKLRKEHISDDFLVPSTFEGCDTVVEEIGEIVPLVGHTDCYDPALGGVSICNFTSLGGTGTLGCKVKKNTPDSDEYILSCNHIIACCDTASLGDFIIQPSIGDGGIHEPKHPTKGPTHPGLNCDPLTFDKCIAELSEVQKVKVLRIVKSPAAGPGAPGSGGPPAPPAPPPTPKKKDFNDMDAAIAKIFRDRRAVEESIEGISGAPTGHGQAGMAMTVMKSGRSSEVTQGVIISIDYDANNIPWSSSTSKGASSGSPVTTTFCFASFQDQIVIAPLRGHFGISGDSGAVILNSVNKKVVGLLWSTGHKHGFAIANHIKPILKRFDVHIMTV